MTLPGEDQAAAPPPDDVAVYFDPLSYAAYDHPYDIYRQLRDHAPVYYNERRNLYVISRHADVEACLLNHKQLVNALGNDIDGTHESYGTGNLVAQDPPRHPVLRAAVRQSFGSREIDAMEDGIRAQATALVTAMRERGGGDYTLDFALPLAFGAALRLVGIPESEADYYQQHLLRSMVRTVGQLGLPADAVASNHESEDHLAEIIGTRIRDIEAGARADTTDVISQILLAVKGGKVEEAEIVGLAHLILSAATDAPAALLTNCIAVLDTFPALQAYLGREPSMIRAFIEETLRYESPAQNLSRQSNADIEIAGTTIPADSRVMVLMASANRDERVFADPDRFDITRTFGPQNRVLAFGHGLHFCMGAPLARLTARVAMEAIVGGPEFRIVGTPERWVKQMVRGYSRLPIQFVG
jgi:cytochrome P450